MLVHHSRLPAWPCSTSDDPYFGPHKILSVDCRRITVRCSPRLGGTLVCAAQQLKRYYNPEDLCGEEVGRYLRELGMPPLTLQEEGLTKGTSCPSHCPMSGAS